ncbi:sugar O-acetyltransferase [Acutalibacter caecimuris]|uniref:sugar O-acetyltransferase n=1 Tax=Acutalibacter caecimuris TaxID=3093657 RepID=UPI002AC984F2|nr:sugar O-acetyltransferase [Acutalibacter sp. M00118]
MTKEEERIAAGVLFCPADPELKAIKLRTHNLDVDYNQTHEDEEEKRYAILAEILGEMGEGCRIQGPIAFHYGKHTKIGKNFFGNFNLTIQDDAEVVIGDNCDFGPNVTIVTPVHPMLPEERKALYSPDGTLRHVCYAKPVNIGHNCWLGANVVICPGVTIGDNCVIGAGSVVTRNIPSNSFAAGNPCRVIREITEADSVMQKPEILGGYTAETEIYQN